MAVLSYEDVLKKQAENSRGIPTIDTIAVFSKYKYNGNIMAGSRDTAPALVYPDQFYNFEHPQSPYVEIDIRVGDNADSSGKWVSLVAPQNNFFKDLKIDDNGGAKSFSLSLFDRDFSNLEELISGTVAFSQSKISDKTESKTIFNTEPIKPASSLNSEDKKKYLDLKAKLLDKIFFVGNKLDRTGEYKNIKSKFGWRNTFSNSEDEASNYAIVLLEAYVSLYSEPKNGVRISNNLNDKTRRVYANTEVGEGLGVIDASASGMINSQKFGNVNKAMLLEFWCDFFKYVTDRYYLMTSGYLISDYYSSVNVMLNSLKGELATIRNFKDSKITEYKQEAADTNSLFSLVQSGVDITPNIRIRYGYNDYNQKIKSGTDGLGFKYAENVFTNTKKIITTESDSTIQLSYDSRVIYTNPIVRSPYFYFLITGVQSKISKEGLYYTLTGFSISTMKIDKFKLVQKFAKLKGTPREIIADLMVVFNEQLSSKTDATPIKSPIKLYLAEGTNIEQGELDPETGNFKELEISLGSETCAGKTDMYKSIRSLLNEVCSSCPRKKASEIDSDTVSIPTVDAEGSSGTLTQEKANDLYPLSYRVIENVSEKNQKTGEEKYNEISVVFYYKEPARYKFCRVYDWGMTRETIVKDLEISNKNEYASLASFSIYDKVEKKLSSNDISNQNVGYKTTASNYNNGFMLTNEVSEVNEKTGKSVRFNNVIKESLQNSLYEGSITISGDPFYSFDDNMVPYCYPIKIDVWRPSGLKIDDKGSLASSGRKDSQGVAVRSYVSGYYVITSISHSISSSGYTTTLGIMKYPGIEEALSVKKK